ncbi:homoserine/homoserine lactone efflux protein [Atopomonas sediminilitoris]|uniref:homoserine/homoserine lactone efflux protein n=1 Tax=Atopomonas sediminilitoris TaxID=2919919 RepID=UPI001F4EED20|nr:homoserine/homoserine lactone efflux protein [Atopomonas sediminilitoris]MCJ8169564.1 homoserine/homoserine lactone efflux protein [Atopomonas sediminilitoris]
MALSVWLTFFAACWLLSLSPGAGAVASMSSGVRYGFWRGYWTAIGLQVAMALHVGIVAAGLGALLVASTLAFELIKWLGVAYLVWLGISQWRSPPAPLTSNEEGRPIGRPLSLLLRGFMVNASNPKSIIFILAVLPPFIDPTKPLLVQYLILGGTIIAVDLIVMAGYTGLAARVLSLLKSPAQQSLVNKVFGGCFVLAAGLLATVQQKA